MIYHVLRGDGPVSQEQLDEFGAEGWELVTIIRDDDRSWLVYFMKRSGRGN